MDSPSWSILGDPVPPKDGVLDGIFLARLDLNAGRKNHHNTSEQKERKCENNETEG